MNAVAQPRLRIPALLLLASLLCLAPCAWSADLERVERLLEISGEREGHEQMMNMMEQAMLTQMQELFAEQGVDDRKQRKLLSAVRRHSRSVRETISWEVIRSDIAALYADEFSNADIDAAITFFSTRSGRKFVRRLPNLMQAASQIAQARVSEVMPDLQRSLQADIEAILRN